MRQLRSEVLALVGPTPRTWCEISDRLLYPDCAAAVLVDLVRSGEVVRTAAGYVRVAP